jgi:hypothetical protein
VDFARPPGRYFAAIRCFSNGEHDLAFRWAATEGATGGRGGEILLVPEWRRR